MVMSTENGVTARPIDGKRRGLVVGGSWESVPRIGFERIRVLGPPPSGAQQIRPPEAATGENPGGIKAKERRCHATSYGSKR